MERDSELSDIILTNTKRKRVIKINSGDSTSDFDFDEIRNAYLYAFTFVCIHTITTLLYILIYLIKHKI